MLENKLFSIIFYEKNEISIQLVGSVIVKSFELLPPKRMVPYTFALDHSATLTFVIVSIEILYIRVRAVHIYRLMDIYIWIWIYTYIYVKVNRICVIVSRHQKVKDGPI